MKSYSKAFQLGYESGETSWHLSLEQIAEQLNRKQVLRPHGSQTWTARAVRNAFVSGRG